MTNKLTARRGFVGKVALWWLVTLGAVLLALVVVGSKPQPAQAFNNWAPGGLGGDFPILLPVDKCSSFGQRPPEEGHWVNADSTTRQIFIEEIKLRCEGFSGEPTWTVEVWARYRCGGEPCTVHWPEKQASRTSDGKIYARYNHQFHTHHLYAAMSRYREGKLWVGVRQEPKAPGQGVCHTDDWFNRQ